MVGQCVGQSGTDHLLIINGTSCDFLTSSVQRRNKSRQEIHPLALSLNNKLFFLKTSLYGLTGLASD